MFTPLYTVCEGRFSTSWVFVIPLLQQLSNEMSTIRQRLAQCGDTRRCQRSRGLSRLAARVWARARGCAQASPLHRVGCRANAPIRTCVVGSWYHPDGRQTKSTKTKRALSYDVRLSFVCLSFVKRRRYEYRFRKLVVTQLQQHVTSKSRPVRRRPLVESPTEPLIGSYCALLTPSRCPLQRPKKEIVDHQRFIYHTALMAALAAPVTT